MKPLKSRGSDLDISLWFGPLGQYEAFFDVVEYLISTGAKPNGTLGVHAHVDRPHAFIGCTDYPLVTKPFNSLDQLSAALASSDDCVVMCTLDQVLPTELSVAVQVRFGMSRQPLSDGHPITVVFPEDELIDVRSDGLSIELISCFDSLVENLNPVYGGIFVEYSMPEPTSLRQEDAFYFRDYYVSESVVAADRIDAVIDRDLTKVKRFVSGVVVRSSNKSSKASRLLVSEIIRIYGRP